MNCELEIHLCLEINSCLFFIYFVLLTFLMTKQHLFSLETILNHIIESYLVGLFYIKVFSVILSH